MKNKQSPPTLYAIPVWKLIILWITTWGLYSIYWFYKQWKGVKEIEKIKASPFARSIFSSIWTFSLFPHILRITRKNKSNPLFFGISLAILWLILSFAWRLPNYYEALGFLTFLPLIPVQTAINSYQKGVLSSKFNKLEIILTVIGALFLVLVGLSYSSVSDNLTNQKNSNNIQAKIDSSTPSNTNEWKLFTSAEGNFRILFPEISPKVSTSEAQLQNNQTYHEITYDTFDTKGDEYLVQVDIYPYTLDKSESTLTLTDNHIKQALYDWTVVTESIDKFKGYQAGNLLFKQGNTFIKYRNFMIDNYAYLIGSSSINGDFPQFEKFANSFEYIKNSKSPIINTAPVINSYTGFLSGKDNIGDIKFLQDYMNRMQASKNEWQNAYSNGEFSKQDLDKLLDELSRIISFTKTIISNLQAGGGNINDNISLWKSMMKMHNEAVSISNKMTGQ